MNDFLALVIIATSFSAGIIFGSEMQEAIEKIKPTAHTELHVAASMNDIPRIQKCLEYLNIQNKSGVTPLHCAVYNNSIEAAKILLDQGANWRITFYREENYFNALELAAIRGSEEILALFFKVKSDEITADEYTDILIMKSKNQDFIFKQRNQFKNLDEKQLGEIIQYTSDKETIQKWARGELHKRKKSHNKNGPITLEPAQRSPSPLRSDLSHQT
jgi:hypothetical protein